MKLTEANTVNGKIDRLTSFTFLFSELARIMCVIRNIVLVMSKGSDSLYEH